jgi:hypothetical protein
MCGWRGRVSLVGKREGKAMSNRPFVLYSFIGDRPIVGHSIVFGEKLFLVLTNAFIFFSSHCVLGNLKAKEDIGCSSWKTSWCSREIFASSVGEIKISVETEWSRVETLVHVVGSEANVFWSICTSL